MAGPVLVAAYRLQLRPEFGFAEAAALVPYLAELGISHLYLSPYLQAVRGSTHGYDIVDPTRVNEELGGAEGLERLQSVLRESGLAQLIDIVPNHMAIVGNQNPWWWDVLENGPSSRYAAFFDVDWEASEARRPNKILLPVLADHYGRVLEAGELRLIREGGAFRLRYKDQVFPVDPSSLSELLERAAEARGSALLKFLAHSSARLPRPTAASRQAIEWRHHDKIVLEDLLSRLLRENPEAAAAVDADVARINADPDALDAFIDGQNYRLAFWRAASRDLGYRRFFDVNSLAGLRAEDEDVFRTTHRLILDWVRSGLAQGLRVDHPDGLRDPSQYLDRLAASCPEAWIVVEKILAPEEKLPKRWPVAGTTGYDFGNLAAGLFVDPNGEGPLTRFYEEFCGEKRSYAEVVRASKRQVLDELLGSDLDRLAALFVDVCESHRRHRDYTRQELRDALQETAACFPVYRTYVRAAQGDVSRTDAASIRAAVGDALGGRPEIDAGLFRFLEDILLLHVTGPLESELVMRFQQLTAPAMAKGVEDTAFYRYNRLVALNEVGGDPARFGVSPARFHQACRETQAGHPRTLLTASTHDTKRSGDVRVRLALLSEIPDKWAAAVRRWAARSEGYRANGAPERNMEYLFYQTLVGAWPIDGERMAAYMEKAAREAKVQTSWHKMNEVYEAALRTFIRRSMDDPAFMADVESFTAPLIRPGRTNSLAQTLLVMTAPGVPDVYQGTELWNLSLVDPDNRRPVDFGERQKRLSDLSSATPEDVTRREDDGLPKLWVISRALAVRRRMPGAFGPDAAYRALAAGGAKAKHVTGFVRGEAVATLVPRLVLGLGGRWGATTVTLPEGRWTNALTGEEQDGGERRLSELLARFPVALLFRKE